MGNIVFIDDDYAIIQSVSPFSALRGFNVYRLDDGGLEHGGLEQGTKINDRWSWFKTAAAAAEWLAAYRSERSGYL